MFYSSSESRIFQPDAIITDVARAIEGDIAGIESPTSCQALADLSLISRTVWFDQQIENIVQMLFLVSGQLTDGNARLLSITLERDL